jgi:4-amino-4-deoxy-L-arabinose transferase-like glycosyltransferase/membrane-associated phospholipid phosphatase
VHWLQALDVGLFRFINQTLNNPVFDVLMPFASGNRFFIPGVLVAAALLLWKGGARGRLCVLMLVLILWPGDSFICNTIKHAIARPRPFEALEDVRLPGYGLRNGAPVVTMGRPQDTASPSPGRTGYSSMPSSHAANWFAGTMIFLLYYRRSWRFMLPMACVVSFSRVYNGVHYPSDVLAGAILGAGYAAAGLWAFDALWQWGGQRWFPLWCETLPSLLSPACRMQKPEPGFQNPPRPAVDTRHPTLDTHWLHLGYLAIAVLLLFRLIYEGSGVIELTEDEAYQWVWSKHLALSYYSKPPLIAFTQFLGTHLWGDTEFGVRFFSPVIGGVLSLLLLRFFAREVNARAGFFLLLIVTATPLMALGSVLMTIDPLSVLFWTCAMIAGWRAVQPGAKPASWLWTGLWMGFGFLSKYTELFQWLCWIVFFVLWKPARAHLRRPGPYLALLINLICALPVLIWNQQHQWITVTHVSESASIGKPWHPTLRHFFDFMGAETGLLNPVFFVGTIWAAIAFWRRNRHDPRLVYLFSMGAPLFLCYALYTFHSGVLPNWIAPSVLPLFCLMVIYWDTRWRLGVRAIKRWLIAGLSIGLPAVALLHDTNLVQRVVGRPLPPKPDPLTRVRGYRTMAEVVGGARAKLLAEGKPVFVIGAHYGTTGLLSFYLPEARTNVVDRPLVYYLSSDRPANQFYFWPGYQQQRKGQNAVFVREISGPPLVHDWISRWLAGEKDLFLDSPQPPPAPPSLRNEFDSIADMGSYNVLYRGRVFHTIQIFECRNLR